MKIPYKIKKDNKVYIYQKRCNKNLFLYKEEKTGFRECFLLQDIIEYKNEKKKNRSKNMILIKLKIIKPKWKELGVINSIEYKGEENE